MRVKKVHKRDNVSISFVVPGIPVHVVGGVKVILEYANRLSRRNDIDCVHLYFLANPEGTRLDSLPLPGALKKSINHVRCLIHPNWFAISGKVKKHCIFDIDDQSIEDANWVIATAAVTALPVHRLSGAKGKKAYLIQGYENWDMDDSEVDSTYKLGMLNIAISKWLQERVRSISGDKCAYISNPIDTGVFRRVERIKRMENVVAVYYREEPHKGFRHAWEAIRIAKEQVPDMKVLMFGTEKRPENLPDWVEYTRNASEEELCRIYNTSSVYVCASINEGYGLTCVEAMACGCALVVSDFLGAREYAVDGYNALVTEVRDVEAMAVNIAVMLTDNDLRTAIGNCGIATARNLDWDAAVGLFSEALGLDNEE